MKRVLAIAWQFLVVGILCASMVSMTACTVDEVLTSIDVALQTAQGLSSAVGAVSPADGAVVTLVTTVAEGGIQAIQAAYDAYEKNKTANNLANIVAAAQALQTNLPALLASAHIVDPTVVQKVTAWVNLMVDIAQSIVTEVNAVKGPVTTAHSVQALYTAQRIQLAWQQNVCLGDAGCAALVVIHKKHAPRKYVLF